MIPINVHLKHDVLVFVPLVVLLVVLPPALVVDDQRSPGVAQAGVVLAGFVPRAEHLRVQLWDI